MAVIWNVVGLDATVATGAINIAHWEASDYEVVDGVTHRGRVYGSVNLEANVDAEGFIPWADVTKENAIAWTKAALDASGDEFEGVVSIESHIADEIAKSKVPVTIRTNPWEMGDDF